MCRNCCQDSYMRSRECALRDHKNGDYLCPLSCVAVPQLSTVTLMFENTVPNFVYMRSKEQANPGNLSSEELHRIIKRNREASEAPSVAVRETYVAKNCLMPCIKGASVVKELVDKNIVYRRKKPQGQYSTVISAEFPCLSVVSSDSPSDAVKGLHVASQHFHIHSDPFVPIKVFKRVDHVSKSESTRQKVIEVDSVNDSCSSLKSDTELSTSMQTEVDDSVGCSSSCVIATEFMEEGISEMDLCISIIRSQGVLDRILPSGNHASVNGVGDSSASSSFRLCKICSNQDYALKMLICDSCEEAFHLFCCNPRIKRIPDDEWFCHSCSKKHHKSHKETMSTSPCLISEKGRGGSSFIEESNPIVLMLRDSGPYTGGVRCGKGFQAEVSEWSRPITTEMDTIPEPLEIDPSDFASSTELNLNKRTKLSTISNWLQCREESADETICGKWRRAPLFEVQSDEWDCFSSVLWDPTRADCTVPQEIGTDEVVKQLKYIQMLRPRLEAKRQRLEHRKNDNKDELRNLP